MALQGVELNRPYGLSPQSTYKVSLPRKYTNYTLLPNHCQYHILQNVKGTREAAEKCDETYGAISQSTGAFWENT